MTTTIKQIKDVFVTNGFNECHHDQNPCYHCLEVKQIDNGIFTAEIDEDLDWEKKDLFFAKWTWELNKLGLLVLDRINTSSGEAQWNGSVWILRRIRND